MRGRKALKVCCENHALNRFLATEFISEHLVDIHGLKESDRSVKVSYKLTLYRPRIPTTVWDQCTSNPQRNVINPWDLKAIISSMLRGAMEKAGHVLLQNSKLVRLSLAEHSFALSLAYVGRKRLSIPLGQKPRHGRFKVHLTTFKKVSSELATMLERTLGERYLGDVSVNKDEIRLETAMSIYYIFLVFDIITGSHGVRYYTSLRLFESMVLMNVKMFPRDDVTVVQASRLLAQYIASFGGLLGLEKSVPRLSENDRRLYKGFRSYLNELYNLKGSNLLVTGLFRI